MLDFYTIKTTVDIETNKAAAAQVLSFVGIFSQPMIVGDVVKENGFYLIRFALRLHVLRPHEQELIAQLATTEYGFTAANTEVIRAARI